MKQIYWPLWTCSDLDKSSFFTFDINSVRKAEGWRELGGQVLLFGPQSEGKEKLTAIRALTFCKYDWSEIGI